MASCRHVVIGYAGSVKLCAHLTMMNVQYAQFTAQAPNKLRAVLRFRHSKDTQGTTLNLEYLILLCTSFRYSS